MKRPLSSVAKFLLIIPTYNEIENISGLIQSIHKLIKTQNLNLEILVVDDNSPDGTSQAVKNLDLEFVEVLDRPAKNGLGEAYKDAFDLARMRDFDYVIEMDADFSHQVDDLLKLIQADLSFDLVIGSRWIAGGKVINWPFYRILISRAGNFYAKTLLRLQVKDLTSGFRRISIAALSSLDLSKVQSSGYGFQVEVANLFTKSGMSVLEVPITFIERTRGKSKMTTSIALEAFLNVTRKALING